MMDLMAIDECKKIKCMRNDVKKLFFQHNNLHINVMNQNG